MNVLLIVSFLMLAPAGSFRPRQLETPEDLRAQVERSIAIGRQLYLLDKAAAIASDTMLESFKEPGKLAGYLPAWEAGEDGSPGDSFIVSFYTRDDPPRIACEVRVGEKKPELRTFEPPKPASSSFVTLVRARKLALDARPENGQRVNPVVLPGAVAGERGILVYLLAGTTKANVAVFGRHFRALISEDATSVVSMTPLSKTALEMPMNQADCSNPVGLFVRHAVTDYPLETHVFTSLLTKSPVVVGTNRGMWKVDGTKVSLVDDKPPTDPPEPGGAARAGSVRERVRSDRGFRMYAVVFGVTVLSGSSAPIVRVEKVIDPRSGSTDPVNVDVPDAFVQQVRKLIAAKHDEPRTKDGKPVEYFTYFYYAPERPGVVVTDLDKPLDQQP